MQSLAEYATRLARVENISHGLLFEYRDPAYRADGSRYISRRPTSRLMEIVRGA